MKRSLYILSGIIIGSGICIGFAWLLGVFFGPLYQGEDEATRNFKIFLGVFIFFIVVGGLISDKVYNKKTKKVSGT